MTPDPVHNQQELFVAIGRIEAKVDNLNGVEERLRKVEQNQERNSTEIHDIKKRQERKPSWTAIVGAVAAIVGGVGGFIGVLVMMNTIADALSKAAL